MDIYPSFIYQYNKTGWFGGKKRKERKSLRFQQPPIKKVTATLE